MLIDNGANKDATEKRGFTALMILATVDNHFDCVRLLIDCGADMDAKSDHGLTALMIAATKENTTCARLLMDGGANADVKDGQGKTALMVAADNGRTDCARLLLIGGANKDTKDKSGLTALDWARRKGKHDVVRLIESYAEAKSDEMALVDLKRHARFMGRACHNCFNTKANMLKCSLCLTAHYCTKECQKTNWPLHKAACGGAASVQNPASRQRSSDESISSAGSILPHNQQSDGKSVKEPPSSQSGLDACHFCAKSQAQVADRLKRCDRCRNVAYCSVQCQRGDWSAHKKQCGKAAMQDE
jgi:hypothetical protein